MRILLRIGCSSALALIVGVVAATPAAAKPLPPLAPVTVIPGGPPSVLAGDYSGAGTLAIVDDPVCQTQSSDRILVDSSGQFSHPSLGVGTYEFHTAACLGGPLHGGTSFVLNGSKLSLSGAVSPMLVEAESGLSYGLTLIAGGRCTARFLVLGVFESAGPGGVIDEFGTLMQQGAIVCRLSREA